jgi:trehalose utilization protein
MITEIKNFLTKEESEWYIDWYKENTNQIFRETNQFVTNYEGIEVDRNIPSFPLFKKISPKVMDFLRIQKTDKNVIPNEIPHTHPTPYNFVIFLNEGFEGGNLVFETGEVFKPKVGTMIFFEGGDGHYPTPVIEGERWVIACFLNSWINLKKEFL